MVVFNVGVLVVIVFVVVVFVVILFVVVIFAVVFFSCGLSVVFFVVAPMLKLMSTVFIKNSLILLIDFVFKQPPP